MKVAIDDTQMIMHGWVPANLFMNIEISMSYDSNVIK